MLYLKDIRNWIKELNASEEFGFENFYVGKLDNKKEKAIGVYNIKNVIDSETFMVGDLATYDILNVSILIHYTNSFNETEEASYKFYNYLKKLVYNKESFLINEHEIYAIIPLTNNEDVGQDNNGIYERVINFKVYYENKI